MSLAAELVRLAAAVRDKFNAINSRLVTTGGVTGQALTKLASGFGWTTSWILVPKPSDTSRANTTTTTADPHLTLALAVGTYRLRVHAVFDTVSQTDYKYKTAFTGSMTAIHRRKQMIAGAAAGTDLFTEAVATGMVADQAVVGTVSGPVIVEIDLTIVVTVTGTFSFDWAQGTTGAQNCTLKAGSYIDYLKVA